jgi:tripartite-type tricarboxylate transporter receptor subunit TctC
MYALLRFIAIAVAASAWAAPGAALAQQPYPTKSVRMLVGFPPGGGTDIVGRIVAQKLGEALGQQVIVDNRPGATSMLAAELTARAAPDGYTVMMAHIAAMSILPSVMAKMPYDAQKDFAPITLAAIGPNLLVVHPSLPVRSVKELVALAKARPGQLQFASPGNGSVQHIAGELFKLQAKVEMLHIPYKGSGQSIIDLLAGQVHMNFDSVPPVLGYVRQGRLRALAVTSAARSTLLPDIPTINESGLPGFDMSTWWGLVAPAAVSREIIARLAAETVKVLRQPDLRDRLAHVGAEPGGNTPEQFGAFMRDEAAKYAKVVKAANIRIE